MTRRPNGRQRQFALVTKSRLKNLSAPFDVPGAELAEVPVIGYAVLFVVFLVLVVVVGLLLGGFVAALVELLALAAIGIAGSLWAWMRGHPKVSVADIGDQRWVRSDGPAVSVAEDDRQIRLGANPSDLGYHLLK